MALTKPFAENGDKKAIPENTTGDGSLSYETGFGGFYALPPEEGGLFIDRAQFNQLMYDTTSAVIENKQEITTQANRINEVNTTLTQSINTKANQATTYTKTEVNNLVNTKANADAVVNLTSDQTIAGIKTFSSPVVVPNGTANTHAVNLAQLNTKANSNATVNLTGNQTIAGIKTFSSVPVCATQPTNANQVANKAYVDGLKQVPDYSAAINITPNKAFTPAFNGVVEVYCRFNINQGFRISLGNTDNTNTILAASCSGTVGEYAGGQAIIVKGQTYFFYANIYTLHRAIICPFKGVKQ